MIKMNLPRPHLHVSQCGGQYSTARYVGVSHTGLRLVSREKSFVDDYLSVLEDIK